jgi:hypothetical protein
LLGSHRGGPGSIPGLVKWDLWWTKWRWGRFSPRTSVSPAIHSPKFSILTITRGSHTRTVNGRGAEWNQFGLHPPLYATRKIVVFRKKLARNSARTSVNHNGGFHDFLQSLQTNSRLVPQSSHDNFP